MWRHLSTSSSSRREGNRNEAGVTEYGTRRLTVQPSSISLPNTPTVQNSAYDFELQKRDETIELGRAVNESLTTAARRAEEELRQTKRKVTRLETQLEESKEELRAATDYTDTTTTALHSSNFGYVEELAVASGTISELTAQNQELQAQVARLEEMVRLASQEGGTDFKVLEAERFNLQKSHDQLNSKLQSWQALNSKLRNTVTVSKTRIAALEDENREFKERCTSLDQCRPQTLRSLLTMRLMEHAPYTHGLTQDEWLHFDTKPLKPSVLNAESLDKPCSPGELQDYVSFLSKDQVQPSLLSSLKLQICSRCNKAKIKEKMDNKAAPSRLSEYHNTSRYFSCCYEQVCKMCFNTYVVQEFVYWWCFETGRTPWIHCPGLGCNQYIAIQCEADVEGCIGRLCGFKADFFTRAFHKIVALRKVLEEIVPRPPRNAREKGLRLHYALTEAGRMFDFFDTRFDATVADETGCIPDFDPGTIFGCVMDGEALESRIPLFRKFLRRQSASKECVVCSKAFHEIDYGDVETWKKACEGFEGPWMWNILIFPTSESQKCDHDFDICRNCTEKHLQEMLSSGGTLSCPQCRRKLEFQEVQALADDATFKKYDKFLLQNGLSKLPDFRWCLNPSCVNGELYEPNRGNPEVGCSDCGHTMCFFHSVPWHHGLSCAGYDSQKKYGDPNFMETQNWIKTNTKPCPGCQVGIQKGEACFHMTCSQCRHEFCWQCLANWTDIKTSGQSGHANGCFFRTNNIRADRVLGENIEVALRATNNRPR